jgi:flagellar hook-basal body complex protein FliE
MSLSISRLQTPAIPEISRNSPSNKPNNDAGPKFSSMLETAIDQVERSRTNAASSMEQLLTGEKDEIHSTVLAVQQAELQLDMFLQVRNKVVAAYQEVMKMQV